MQLLQALYTHAGVQIPASPESSMRACMSKASMPEIESVHKPAVTVHYSDQIHIDAFGLSPHRSWVTQGRSISAVKKDNPGCMFSAYPSQSVS